MSGTVKYIYKLESWEKQELEEVIFSKNCGKERRLHAYILLKCDSGLDGGSWSDAKIVDAYSVSLSQIYTTRKSMVEHGIDSALNRNQRITPPTPRKLDGEKEARLVSIACSDSPEGYSSWTMQLLANELIRLEVVDTISAECVRETLKKTSLNLG